MNRVLYSSLFLGALALSCAPQSGLLYVDHFFSADPDVCAAGGAADAPVGSGVLDLAPGGVPEFHVGLVVLSSGEFHTQEITVNDESSTILEPADRNRPILDRVTFSYEKSPSSLKLPKGTVEVARLVRPDEDGSAVYDNVNLLSQEAGEALLDGLGVGDTADLVVTVEVQGYMSGSGNRISTGEMDFPIRVIYSDAAECGAPGVRQQTPNDCAYPGQATTGKPIVCCNQLIGTASGCN